MDSIELFFHTETTEKYPSFADSLRLPVHRSCSGIIEAGLWECNIGWSPLYQLCRLQSVMNAAARFVFSASRYDQIMPLVHRLHWLHAPQRISFKLAVLAFLCLRGLSPTYLSDSLRHVADLPGRQRLRSASSADLAVPQTCLQSVIERSVLRRQKPGTVFHQK